MSDADAPTLYLYAGQVNSVPLEFLDEDGVAVNLTGSTVHFAAKKDFADANASISSSQATHTTPASGLTTLPINLASADATWFAKGARLVASLWIVDSNGQKVPQGNLVVQVLPSTLPRV
jgi:hypothetical protein